ncbi:MAG: hypothetical protein U0X91_04400 [Spirosomataceae bacterium]
MKTTQKSFFSFKTICLTVCGLYVFLAGSLFLQGLIKSMSLYNVPPEILASPHYYDAIFWVYTHMIVIGLLIGCVGLYAENFQLKKKWSVLLFVAHLFYTYLDFRSSDSFLGNGLYQGPASVFPAIIGSVITLLFFYLSISLTETKKS